MLKKLNKEQMCQVERIDYCLGNGIFSPKKKNLRYSFAHNTQKYVHGYPTWVSRQGK